MSEDLNATFQRVAQALSLVEKNKTLQAKWQKNKAQAGNLDHQLHGVGHH